MAQDNGIKGLRCGLLFFWLASAAALAGALISQFVFGLRPCHLCLLQRWPYGIVLLLLTPLFFYKQLPAERIRVAFIVLGLLFLVDSGIALYHTGVEQKWWAGPTDCTSDDNPQTIEALTQSILNATVVPCDKPSFIFLGLSMAAWNMFYAFALFVLAIWRSRN